MGISIEMPKYKCHKDVWALKIRDIKESTLDGKLVTLEFEEIGYASLGVDADWYYKHKPVVGGYYVVYKDGYSSFSPKQAFEDGYSLIK